MRRLSPDGRTLPQNSGRSVSAEKVTSGSRPEGSSEEDTSDVGSQGSFHLHILIYMRKDLIRLLPRLSAGPGPAPSISCSRAGPHTDSMPGIITALGGVCKHRTLRGALISSPRACPSSLLHLTSVIAGLVFCLPLKKKRRTLLLTNCERQQDSDSNEAIYYLRSSPLPCSETGLAPCHFWVAGLSSQ